MTIELGTPDVAGLARVTTTLAGWQDDDWPGHLHPGDLGWHSTVGAEQTARHVRTWTREDLPVAIGLLDDEVLRLAVSPAAADDPVLAQAIADDLADPAGDVLDSDEQVVEARGARALLARLRADGWDEDEPWTPLRLHRSATVDQGRPSRVGLRVEQAGPDHAADWFEVHWSAFRGTPLDADTRSRLTERWVRMATGPFAPSGHHLIGYDAHDEPVAVTSVWTAGPHRPGLIEPLAVHRDHAGHGYGTAMTVAGARTLFGSGASSAVVVAENANQAALATYLRAGFTAQPSVTDLRGRRRLP